MGPTLILDKSALQSLSKRECFLLHKYFFVNIPPVLIMEILADIKKTSKKRSAKMLVGEFAGKLIPGAGGINAHFLLLLQQSLQGFTHNLDGRIVVPGEHVRTSSGEIALVAGVAPEEEAMSRWRDGDFEASEEVLAERWREITKGFDAEGFQRTIRGNNSEIEIIASPEDLLEKVDGLLRHRDLQTKALEWILVDYAVPPAMAQHILQRWINCGYESLEIFAPYAHHCIRVGMFYYLGLYHKCAFIGTRATNRVDLEYLYYLPFCNIFASGDEFHERIVKVFLNPGQVFVGRDELKEDFGHILQIWEGMSIEDRQYLWPPRREGSIVFDLWKRYVKLSSMGDRDVARSLPKETTERLLRLFREKKAQIADGSVVLPEFNRVTNEPDFVMLKKTSIRLSDPCPCGSGEQGGNCCLSKLVK